MNLLTVENIGVDFGGVKALDGISLQVRQGEVFSLIGPNGAGKTTLFNVITGVYTPQRGQVLLRNQPVTGLAPWKLARAGLSRTFQNLQVFGRMTALENVMVGRHRHERGSFVGHLFTLPSVLRQNALTAREAQKCLDRVGLSHTADLLAAGLPYGESKRLEIARALATEPTLLLLDEPAAGCNPAETDALADTIRTIADSGITVVLIEHDMKLVMRISDRIHVLNQGRSLAEGRGEDIMRRPEVIAAYLGEHGSKEALRA
ncbi:MAG: ABC transporter ATP-binding protein [Hydrogenophaga sp.]|uniref:ABC transporter ATP-binding protein n=1 Tax=Hydrogenophaga sp. TaxID=1904254 RepID=UPI002601924D|nr:ABC transporter ATP-binding protein [Hydrogenophaga sp.]MCW5668689.1 ABC transporter ATP-binding protein [Hydrogenophaga sp.]